jgi:tetratricopeptide (TPR) repeat protein
MKIIFAAAAMLLVCGGSFTFAAESPHTAVIGLLFPEPVDRGIARQALETKTNSLLTYSATSELGFQWEQYGLKPTTDPWPNLNQTAPEQDPFRSAEPIAVKEPGGRKTWIELQMLEGMATLAERRKNWPEAQARLEEYLKKSPEDLNVLVRLARVVYCQKDTEGAYDVLMRAKLIDVRLAAKYHSPEQLLPPDRVLKKFVDLYEHGVVPLSGRLIHDDKAALQSAVKRAPNDLDLRAVFASWALDNDETALAKEQADAALRIEAAYDARPSKQRKYRGSTTGHTLSGDVALWEKRWADAERHYEKVLLQEPNDFAASDRLARALVEQKDPAKKAKALEIALASYKKDKKNVHVLTTLSWVYFRKGDFDRASSTMEELLRDAGGQVTDPDALTCLAHVLDHNGLNSSAKQILQPTLNEHGAFSMRPEAVELYEKVKDAKGP